MTEKSQLIDREKVKAEEYEVQLFGFSIDEFIGDNESFIMTEAKKELQSIQSFLMRRAIAEANITDPEKIDKIKADMAKAFTEDSSRIRAMVKEKLETKYNSIIREYMNIPDNCLLRTHMLHDDEELKKISAEDVKNLQKEIDDMQLKIKRNATFIQALSNEAEGYDRVADVYSMNLQEIKVAKEVLENNIDATILVENAKKLQSLKKENSNESENSFFQS